MKEDEIENYKKAGEVAKKVREYANEILNEGINYGELADKINEKIIELGMKPAFPVNISVNEIAAHDTALLNEERIIKKGDIVKVDIGVSFDGYIADTAFTKEISTSKNQDLIKASEEALKHAIEIVKPGIKISDIGRVIQEKIKEFGFTPISNLSGHHIARYEIHTGESIPNIDNGSTRKLEIGDVIAIEPFATNGVGLVVEGRESEIYRVTGNGKARLASSRELLSFLSREYDKLPFAKRWLRGFANLDFLLADLVRNSILHNYHILREKGFGLVSQFEHTILVLENPIITTI
ncbi:MAG: type II methionyl aminopeptidase [Candidatus Parvarchaeota archaeon]|nr:type II methionyl aminopeptidase [Candidatus Jingweiarchaeum tengchongense]MCW1298366.1 type II methionyl aminopeptidase [Candidatus Jingweiarchaeum tengchongense]MCW1300332.1 type II methionyl aminopeptidase [Candidatus Jingweiarchaeum tengchongense]MCW1304871.1 type II methionyl aminopeptidase [Candidatus Jingweiarchaeum tengchongense]MCW1305828.1 type II methionyl aminopeptidase [Candidatus Jingweiarchaeum tengchongense]